MSVQTEQPSTGDEELSHIQQRAKRVFGMDPRDRRCTVCDTTDVTHVIVSNTVNYGANYVCNEHNNTGTYSSLIPVEHACVKLWDDLQETLTVHDGRTL